MCTETRDASIILEGVGKHYGISPSSGRAKKDQPFFWALKGVSVSIPKGVIVGLLGRNGAGKTTLLSLLAGIVEPSSGAISIEGCVARVLTLGSGFQDELTGRENVYLNGSLLGMTNDEIKSKFESILAFSELNDFIDVSLGKYSQGMRLRLGFSIAMHLDFDSMLIDEVLMVGDGGFQKKCFEKLIEFKKKGKTLIITTQSLDVIERLSDMVLVLEQGRIVSWGDVSEGVACYKQILHKHTGLHVQEECPLVKQTKWWVEPEEEWGAREGSRELSIDNVRFVNRWGQSVKTAKAGMPLCVCIDVVVHETVYRPHIGVALFREDGVYCFGPNTSFDNVHIDSLMPGCGRITLQYAHFDVMPGDYRFSIVVWDEHETLAYDYLKGFFSIAVVGQNPSGQLAVMRATRNGHGIVPFLHQDTVIPHASIQACKEEMTQGNDFEISDIVVGDGTGDEVRAFVTEDPFSVTVHVNGTVARCRNRYYVWAGIFRADGVLCAGFTREYKKGCDACMLRIKKIMLLPGEYCVSAGVWDAVDNEFVVMKYAAERFSIQSHYKDHGTIYMPHSWRMRMHRGGNV